MTWRGERASASHRSLARGVRPEGPYEIVETRNEKRRKLLRDRNARTHTLETLGKEKEDMDRGQGKSWSLVREQNDEERWRHHRRAQRGRKLTATVFCWDESSASKKTVRQPTAELSSIRVAQARHFLSCS